LTPKLKNALKNSGKLFVTKLDSNAKIQVMLVMALARRLDVELNLKTMRFYISKDLIKQ
jgi:hypothetical protein